MATNATNNSPSEPRTWWERALPAMARAAGPHGDVIAGNVGQGAAGVIIGKGNIQIGTLAVPVLPFILMLALAVLVVGTIAVRSLGPAAMTGNFNIAVAEFGEVGERGLVHRSELGQSLSAWVYSKLQTELDPLREEFLVQVWHDSMDLTEKRAKIGIIPGTTPEERAREAAALARRIKANIVIYGNHRVDESPASFRPEFYVASLDSGDIDELVGRYELGDPIPVPADADSSFRLFEANQVLAARTEALTFFTAGLVLESARQFEAASTAFQRALAVEHWDEDQGKEMIYLFLGREATLLDQDEEAEKALWMALELDPGFSRAYFGLGNLRYRAAKAYQQPSTPAADDAGWIAEVEHLANEALEFYALAEEHAGEEDRTWLKARLAQGATNQILGNAYRLEGDPELAAAYLAAAVEEIEATVMVIPGEDRSLRAYAYLDLGVAHQRRAEVSLGLGHREDARQELHAARAAYARCVEEANTELYDWFVRDLWNQCTEASNAIDVWLDSTS
jgi:hypothetical protein